MVRRAQHTPAGGAPHPGPSAMTLCPACAKAIAAVSRYALMRKCTRPQTHRNRNATTAGRYQGARPEPRARRTVLLDHARRLRRAGDQDRAARPGRHRARLGLAAAGRGNGLFRQPASQQAGHGARSEESRGQGDVPAPGRALRRGAGELPRRRARAPGAGLRNGAQAQSRHHLLLDFRLRPGRPLPRPPGARPDSAGRERHDQRHRRSRRARRARRRLHRRPDRRHERRVRHHARAAGEGKERHRTGRSTCR